jgi:hypothetical protein
MSTPNPILKAAAPSLIQAIAIFNQFETDMGTDPAQWPLKFMPAKLKAVGALGLLVQPLIGAEVVAGENVINTTTAGWVTQLQAIEGTPAT